MHSDKLKTIHVVSAILSLPECQGLQLCFLTAAGIVTGTLAKPSEHTWKHGRIAMALSSATEKLGVAPDGIYLRDVEVAQGDRVTCSEEMVLFPEDVLSLCLSPLE